MVLAASYEARAHGVSGGMPGWRARQLCPSIQFVAGHFREYQRLGDAVMAVFRDFTPLVERVSIDEGFLDVAGAVHLFGSPGRIAVSIRQRVRDEIGLPVSVGVARTKHLAKVASQVAKPDGLVVVEPGDERVFLDPLPVRLIWGVGRVTQETLHQAGIDTIGQLASADSSALRHLIGDAAGQKLASLSTNVDPRPVGRPDGAKSVGAQSALGRRLPTAPLLRETLGYLADRVAARLRGANQAGRTVTVRVRFADLRSVTRSVTLPAPVSTTLTLAEVATELAHTAIADHSDQHHISLLAVSVSNLSDGDTLQLELPLTARAEQRERHPGADAGAARWGADRSVDAIREKFGRSAVGYAAAVLSDDHRVPEEFRELAEHPTPDPSG